MSNILVTGATGFTGSHLCKRLVANGEQVVAFVRGSSETRVLEEIGVECRVVDICDPQDVSANFQGIDRVYHIAAAWRAEHADRQEFQRVNVEATRNLLEAAKAANVRRFVHCSTVGVQGDIDDPPADEDYRFQPGDHYQETKLKGELLAREYFADGLPGAVFRPVGIYGPGDTRFLKLFRPISKGTFVMIGTGETLYHLTFIDDLVDGILLVGSREEALGEVFTLAGATYTTLGELADSIAGALQKPRRRLRIPFYPVYIASIVCDRFCRMVGVEPVLYPRRVEFFSKDRAFSIDKAKRMLGYQPKIDLQEGLRRTAEWYREEGLI
ncbi:MAG: NAD-dependent epimerase/dehydratase family protein [Gammaproteobacteria bacterium]|nr:NAD-dependent epimerase/dehydratase family protein [Gammaproteobacteria bacterium]